MGAGQAEDAGEEGSASGAFGVGGSQDSYDLSTGNWEMGFGNPDGTQDTYGFD